MAHEKTRGTRELAAIGANTRRGKPRRTHATLVSFIADQLAYMRPKEIQAAIAAHPTLSAIGVPSLRTIQQMAREAREAPADRWIALEADPEQARLVLSVVRDLIDTLTRQVLALTVAEAETIAWLRTVAPDLPSREALFFARAIARTGPAAQNDRLAPYLALAPWRDGAKAYMRTFGRGRLPAFVFSESTEAAYNTKTAARRERRAAEVPEDWLPDSD